MWEAYTLLLLLSPIDLPTPHRAAEPRWLALKRIALQLEVVGPHERWVTDYRSEVRYVRRHLWELADAPPLADCWWLPSPNEIKECRCFNLGYQRSLEQRRMLRLHRHDELTEALRETQQLAEAWRLVDTASCASNSWVCRRRALARLREVLGPDAYYSGVMPPCVPLWRFAAY
jgi:hypothetical protein